MQLKELFLLLLFTEELFGSSATLYYLFSRDKDTTYSNSFTINTFSKPLTYEYLEQEDANWSKAPSAEEKNYLFAYSSYELSLQVDATTRLAIFDNTELYVNTNRDFLSAFFAIASEKLTFDDSLAQTPLKDKNRRYNVIADGMYYRTKGLSLEKKIELNRQNSFVYRGKVLDAQEYVAIHFNGYLKNNSSKSVTFELNATTHFSLINYINNRVREGANPEGLGIAHDMAYIYEDRSYLFEVGARNIFSFIYWKNMPTYEAVATTPGLYIGDDGYKHYRHALNGNDSTTSIFSALPLHSYGYMEKKEKNYAYSLFVNYFDAKLNGEISVRNEYLEYSYNPFYKSSEVSLYSQYFIVSISQTIVDRADANAVSAALMFRMEL